MRETVADPIDVVRRMYAHFSYPLSAEMVAFMAENSRDKHGSHSYTPAGINAIASGGTSGMLAI
jgi:hypothetical protein